MAIKDGICQNKECGIPFQYTGSRVKKFCSLTCYWQSKLGSGQREDYYPQIRVNGKLVYYHRWQFEQNVRPLEAGEIVHHKNENKKDWSIENLEAKDLAEHSAEHRRKRVKQVEEDFDFWKSKSRR